MDPTTIVAAAIAASGAVGVGYFSMRQQTRAMKEQLEYQRDLESTARAQTRLDGRIVPYSKLLDVDRNFRQMVARGEFTVGDYADWWAEFQPAQHIVVLTGTELVRVLAEELSALYASVDRGRGNADGRAGAAAITLAFRRHESELELTRNRLIAAMREDVAPLEAGSLAVRRDWSVELRERDVEPPPASETRATAKAGQPTSPSATARRFGAVPRARLALVSTSAAVPHAELTRVVAAIQKQIDQDFAPRWALSAELAVYADQAEIPDDSWPVILADDIGVPDMVSYHTDDGGRPYTKVLAVDDWSLYLSHDCLEMIVSPFSNYWVEIASPISDQGIVYLSVNVCDPCAGRECGYDIEGVRVADFHSPEYLDLGSQASQFDVTGYLNRPLSLALGGYLTWYDPESHELWRLDKRSDKPSYEKLGEYAALDDAVSALRVQVSFGGPSESAPDR